MSTYKIYAGLGGGFGGAHHVATEQFESESAAMQYAYDCAVEEYQSYEGLHGIVSFGDICENPEDYGLDEDFSDEDAESIYNEEVESWIVYYVKLVE